MAIEIRQYDKESEGSFTATENDIRAGRIFYTRSASGALIIDHTEVSPEFKGKGIGKMLVMAVADMARLQNISIVPMCSFAKSLFDRIPELKELL